MLKDTQVRELTLYKHRRSSRTNERQSEKDEFATQTIASLFTKKEETMANSAMTLTGARAWNSMPTQPEEADAVNYGNNPMRITFDSRRIPEMKHQAKSGYELRRVHKYHNHVNLTNSRAGANKNMQGAIFGGACSKHPMQQNQIMDHNLVESNFEPITFFNKAVSQAENTSTVGSYSMQPINMESISQKGKHKMMEFRSRFQRSRKLSQDLVAVDRAAQSCNVSRLSEGYDVDMASMERQLIP